LPLYFGLRAAGKQVHLASLSFTYLGGTDAEEYGFGVRKVTGTTGGEDGYFPEKHLAAWLAMDGDEKPIWTIERLGLEQLTGAYEMLDRRLEPDAVVVVDGGTDSLMRGDEADLGTPAEDIASILAAAALEGPAKMLVCLGFGIDRFHGVCHAQFLEGVAELARQRAYLGALSLTRNMPEVRKFEGATEYVQAHTPGRESVVCASILSALVGRYGNYHRLERTEKSGSTLWINPLMSLYWFFDLDAVAKRVLYKDLLRGTESLAEINARIEAFRKSIQIRPREDIPV
jgi:hypothetical protein